jgi:ribosome maturation factor RimP
LSRREVLNDLFEAFEPVVRDAGVELLDIELTSEAGTTILRVTIYRPQGVTLDDCVAVDKILSPLLDEIDPFPGSYNLEVSSPGLERRLKRNKEFQIFSGRLCRVNLYGPVDGKRSFQGILMGLTDSPEEAVIINTKEGQKALSRQNISKVQLVYQEESF